MKRLLLFVSIWAFVFLAKAQIDQPNSILNVKSEFQKKQLEAISPVYNLLSAKNVVKYEFETFQSTFTSIASTGTPLTPSGWDDGYSLLDLHGVFRFFYDGKYYDTLSVGTNGGLIVGKDKYLTNSNDLANSTYAPVIAPVWDDLKFYSSGSGDGLFYQIDTIGTDTILTIEWYNVVRYGSSSDATVSFQVKIFSTGTIDFVYGDMSNASNWNASVSIGINDVENGSLSMISVTPGDPATISYTSANNQINGNQLAYIQEGTVYRFVPQFFTYDLKAYDLFPMTAKVNSSYLPQAVILNNGENKMADFTLNLSLFFEDSLVYASSLTVTDSLAPENLDTLEMDSWIPDQPGFYRAVLIVSHPDDENPGNDTLIREITVVDTTILMNNGSDSVCYALFYDDGGPDANYSNTLNDTLTLYPGIRGGKLIVKFNSSTIENGFDYLKVLDGTDASAPVVAYLTGSNYPIESIMASNLDGAFTFIFHSDGSVNYAGWEALISCKPPFDHDLMTMKIEPVYYFHGDTVTPRVFIKNNGTNPEGNFTVRLWDSLGTYDHTLNIADTLQPFTDSVLVFPSWVTSDTINRLYAAIYSDTDQDRTNDTITTLFNLFSPIYSWVAYNPDDYPNLGVITINRFLSQFIQNQEYTGSELISASDYTPYGWLGTGYNGKNLVFLKDDSVQIYVYDSLGVAQITGLTYNQADKYIYISAYDSDIDSTIIYRYNPVNKELDSLGAITDELIISIAANSKGEIYAIGLYYNKLMKLDFANMQVTYIGPLGFNINNAQDIAFDRETDELFGTLYGDQNGLFKIDTASGNATMIYPINAELSATAIPYDYPVYDVNVRAVTPVGTTIPGVDIKLWVMSDTVENSTDSTGIAGFDLVESRYLLQAIYKNDTVSREVVVSSDTVFDVVFNTTYNITFIVSEAKNYIDSAYIVVMYASDTVASGYTDTAGVLNLSLNPGNYTLNVSKEGYQPYSGDLTVSDNDTVLIQLTPGPALISGSKTKISVYPNPATGLINITNARDYELLIYTTEGKMVLRKDLRSDREKLDLNNLPSGIYVLKIVNSSNSLTFRLVKK